MRENSKRFNHHPRIGFEFAALKLGLSVHQVQDQGARFFLKIFITPLTVVDRYLLFRVTAVTSRCETLDEGQEEIPED